MKLSEIFSALTYGELSQLHLGGGEAGEINEANYDRVLSHINLGLTAIYKRFRLKEGRVKIAMGMGRITYPLSYDYAVTNVDSTQPVKYIQDSVEEPFLADVLKVEGVYTDAGWEYGLNDGADLYAISTPSSTVLRVPIAVVSQSPDLPTELKTTYLNVVYRANHPIITQGNGSFDPTLYEVELPYAYLEPLLFFVASRLNNPMGMVNEFNAGNNYAAKYEQACEQLELMNLRVDQGSQPDRISRNGWV